MSIFFYGCITLDGFLAGKNHTLDWLHQCGTTEETGYESFYRQMDITIMGRRTFREIERTDHPERIYPTTQNYVFTHTEQPPRDGFHFINSGIVDFVRQLDGGKNIWIVGGNTILSPLLDEDMVDCLIVQIAPVLLGDGIPLFTQKAAQRRFQLSGVQTYGQFAELTYHKK